MGDNNNGAFGRLIDLNPHLLITPDNDYGRLPIHFAVEYGAPSDLCAQLINRNMKALQIQDKYGLLPIHLCATWNRFDLLPYFVFFIQIQSMSKMVKVVHLWTTLNCTTEESPSLCFRTLRR